MRVDQREGGVEMPAAADRIGQPRQVIREAHGERTRERLDRRRPWRALVRDQLAVQREQPAPAIRSLEPTRIGPVQPRQLARDLGRHQHRIGACADGDGFGHGGEGARQPHHLPPAMDAAMPVETAMEDRVQAVGRDQVARPGQDQVELERPSLSQMPERQGGEPLCGRLVERHANPMKYSSAILKPSSGIAVGACARMTA